MLLGTESLQTFGGSGFLQDYPIEQYVRDAKIDTLYEGTTAIQGQDFFFRKIVRTRAQALGAPVARRSRSSSRPRRGNGRLEDERELLGKALEDVQGIVGAMVGELMSPTRARSGDVTNIYKVGLNTTRLLMAARRPGRRLAAAAPGRGRAGRLVAASAVGQGPRVLRGQGRGGAVLRPDRAAASSPPSARSPRPPTTRSWTCPSPPSDPSKEQFARTPSIAHERLPRSGRCSLGQSLALVGGAELDDAEAEVLVDRDHPRVRVVVARDDAAALGVVGLQAAEVLDLDRHPEPVTAVVAVHEGAPLPRHVRARRTAA